MVCKREMFALGEKHEGLTGLEGKPGGGLGEDTVDLLKSILALLMAQALTHRVPGERASPSAGDGMFLMREGLDAGGVEDWFLVLVAWILMWLESGERLKKGVAIALASLDFEAGEG